MDIAESSAADSEPFALTRSRGEAKEGLVTAGLVGPKRTTVLAPIEFDKWTPPESQPTTREQDRNSFANSDRFVLPVMSVNLGAFSSLDIL